MMKQSTIPHIPFYFIRHGETQWNQGRKIMGHRNIPLNEVGIAHAHKASQYLQDLEIERLVSSPLLRAKETADIIGSYLKLPSETCDDLSEICWGEWEGKTMEEGWDFEAWVKGYTPQGAESCAGFQKRVIQAFATVLPAKKKTLVVAHNGVYWALMNALGYPNSKALNCVPYFLRPPTHPTYPWFVTSLTDERI